MVPKPSATSFAKLCKTSTSYVLSCTAFFLHSASVQYPFIHSPFYSCLATHSVIGIYVEGRKLCIYVVGFEEISLK